MTRRPLLLFGLPTVLLLGVFVLPLIFGARTLVYRDILNSHYPLKAAQTELMSQAPLDLHRIDPFRGGGQPMLGNPNAVPFYPDNVLYRVTHPLWALNAHFWLHWLMAPFAGYWLGRAWRLAPAGAWACGVVWATAGYCLSLLNLYNMVATAALTPALVAAFLALRRGPSPRTTAVAGAFVGLTFLGGDPATACLSYALAAAAWILSPDPRRRRRLSSRHVAAGAGAVGLGAALAAPVVVAMLQTLPSSYRGLWRYDAATILAQSWSPASLLDWLVPAFFGPIGPRFWGASSFGGHEPFLASLAPGWIAVALVLVAGFRTNSGAPGRTPWAWGAIALGIFLALGRLNPVLVAVSDWPGAGLLRYPVKAWLAVALGMSVLAGVGFERLTRGLGRHRFAASLLAVAGVSLALRWMITTPRTLEAIGSWASLGPGQLAAEALRWTGVLDLSILSLVGALLVTYLAGRRRQALALLLVVHSATQLLFHSHLVATDIVDPYTTPPPVLAPIPSGAQVVHGGFGSQFGPAHLDPRGVPDDSLVWWSRAAFAELTHAGGVGWGLEYPFTKSPEGLDSFYAIAVAQALEGLDDPGRLRLLEAASVDFLLLHRDLDSDALDRVDLVGRFPSVGREIRLYRLRHAADDVVLVGRIRPAPHLNAAVSIQLDPTFDQNAEVVLPTDVAERMARREPSDAFRGSFEIRTDRAESFEVTTDSDTRSILVTRRAWLPIWRAEVDGQGAEVLLADGFRMAVEVPAGRHEVRLFVDAAPTRWAFVATCLALAATLVLLLRRPRSSLELDHQSGV